jgi:hypothetical protein
VTITELIAKLQAVQAEHGDIGVVDRGPCSEPVTCLEARLLYEWLPGQWRTYDEGAQSWVEDLDAWIPDLPVLKLEIS